MLIFLSQDFPVFSFVFDSSLWDVAHPLWRNRNLGFGPSWRKVSLLLFEFWLRALTSQSPATFDFDSVEELRFHRDTSILEQLGETHKRSDMRSLNLDHQ